MHIDLRFLIAELITLWVPLSIVMLISGAFNFNWLFTDILLALVYVLISMFHHKSDFISFLFHIEKESGNSHLESILFYAVVLGSILLIVKFWSDSVIGIILFILISTFANSIVIEKKSHNNIYK